MTMGDTDNESPTGRLIPGHTDSVEVHDRMLITLDRAVKDLAGRDLLMIRSANGSDVRLDLVNAPGAPPRVKWSPTPMVDFECPLLRIDDRTWQLLFEPHHSEIVQGPTS